MSLYALVRGNAIVSLIRDDRGLAELRRAFPDIAAHLEAVPDDAACGWSRGDKGFAPPPANEVPREVTNFQARAALLAAGLFDLVDGAVRAQGASSAAFQAWEYANNLTRGGDLVNSMGKALGLTDARLDELFIAASKIEG